MHIGGSYPSLDARLQTEDYHTKQHEAADLQARWYVHGERCEPQTPGDPIIYNKAKQEDKEDSESLPLRELQQTALSRDAH